MARRKQKGANFGKRQGSQSQQVQKSRGRNQIILYSVLGLAGLFLLCGLIWFIFRPTETTTVADDDNNGIVEESDTVASDSDTSSNEGIAHESSDEDAGNTETESGFYADDDDTIVTDEEGEVVSGSDDTDTADSGFTVGELGEPIGGERPMAVIDPAERNGFYAEYPETVIDTSLTYEAVFVTEKGDMRVLLFDDEAPITVNSFVYLAQEGYYDGTTFHRVIDNFMAQGGDPSGTGSGGPGYNFEDEVDNGFAFDRRGLLAMANAGPGTNGSQFFITFVPTPHLNGNHTIFGELLEGDDVLSAITVRNPGAAEPGDTINSVEIYVSEG